MVGRVPELLGSLTLCWVRLSVCRGGPWWVFPCPALVLSPGYGNDGDHRVVDLNFGVVHVNSTSITVEIRGVETGAVLLSHTLPVGPAPRAGGRRAPLQDSVPLPCPDANLAPWVRRRTFSVALCGVAVLLAILVGAVLALWQCVCVAVRATTRRKGRTAQGPGSSKRD